MEPGNIYGLLGRNGAGKTTLLKLMAGLRYPCKGSALVAGHNPASRRYEVMVDVCFIPEEIHVPALTMAQYRRLYGALYPKFSEKLYDTLIKEFELTSEKRLTEFSLGQKKKFLLAFGMSTGSSILILDEPTNGLDIPAKKQFRRLMANVVDEDRLVLISTHQVRDMETLIDPIIILDEGRVVFNEPLHEVYNKLYFGRENEVPKGDDLLWSQEVLGGYETVRENLTGAESTMDLETLFVAVTQSSKAMERIFSKGGRQ
ncbi:ABC transporter ATP-binding protein [Myxococcota bacterium]|nr:ABC transporter ATP-binding protein [Myxococcota bacterium]MBU1534028.1 ABC transporter ATP-binding protein [Myxococcota bacterium]